MPTSSAAAAAATDHAPAHRPSRLRTHCCHQSNLQSGCFHSHPSPEFFRMRTGFSSSPPLALVGLSPHPPPPPQSPPPSRAPAAPESHSKKALSGPALPAPVPWLWVLPNWPVSFFLSGLSGRPGGAGRRRAGVRRTGVPMLVSQRGPMGGPSPPLGGVQISIFIAPAPLPPQILMCHMRTGGLGADFFWSRSPKRGICCPHRAP